MSWSFYFQVEHFLGIKRKGEASDTGTKKAKVWSLSFILELVEFSVYFSLPTRCNVVYSISYPNQFFDIWSVCIIVNIFFFSWVYILDFVQIFLSFSGKDIVRVTELTNILGSTRIIAIRILLRWKSHWTCWHQCWGYSKSSLLLWMSSLSQFQV